MDLKEFAQKYPSLLRLVKIRSFLDGTPSKVVNDVPAAQLGPGEYRLQLTASGMASAGTLSPIAKLDGADILAAAYAAVLTYTVTDKIAKINELSLKNNNEDVGLWRVTIKGVVQFADKKTNNHTFPWNPQLELAQGDVILVEGKSDALNTVKFKASITGQGEN